MCAAGPCCCSPGWLLRLSDKVARLHLPVIISSHSRRWFVDSNKPSDTAVSGEHGGGSASTGLCNNECAPDLGTGWYRFWEHVTGGRAPVCSLTRRLNSKEEHAPREATRPVMPPLHTSVFCEEGRGCLTCYGVKEHQVLEVGDLPPLPALRHVGGLVQLSGRGQRDPPAEGAKRNTGGVFARATLKTRHSLAHSPNDLQWIAHFLKSLKRLWQIPLISLLDKL